MRPSVEGILCVGEAQSCSALRCENNYWGLSVFGACFPSSAVLSETQKKETRKEKLGKIRVSLRKKS
jgi:hypothetical protein